MAHTNSTTNYGLPQFISTDKPAWLTDINGAFSDIDTNLKAASDAASTADGKAVAAQSAATAADTKIGQLGALNTDVKTSIVDAINSVHTDISYTDPDGKYIVRKYGNIVEIEVRAAMNLSVGWNIVGTTLPEVYRPTEDTYVALIDNDATQADALKVGCVYHAGNIRVYSYSAYTNHLILGTFIYIE